MAPPALDEFDGVQWSHFEGWLGKAEYFTGMELKSRSMNWSPFVWRARSMDWQPDVGTFPEEDWHGCIVGGEWLPRTKCDVLSHPCHRTTSNLLLPIVWKTGAMSAATLPGIHRSAASQSQIYSAHTHSKPSLFGHGSASRP